MYNIFSIILSVLIPAIVVREPIQKMFKEKRFSSVLREYSHEFILYVFLVIGLFVRSFWIDKIPNTLNADETAAGYDAFSILNYGIDRNNNVFPVLLESFGSGQNALYTYLMIPFIKVLGLSVYSVRIPMVIISSLSLFVWYKLLELIKDKRFALYGLMFLVICPWHIMKSRWGLESNIFPDLVLYAVYFIARFIKENKLRYFYTAFVILGFTAYAYGTSYLFLPLFVLGLLIFFKCKKLIKIKDILLALLIVGLISLPIILYVIINHFDLNEFRFLGVFTIPKLAFNRASSLTSLNIVTNFCQNFLLLIIQNDSLIYNSFPFFGVCYIISFLFILFGLVKCYKKNETYHWIMNIWFITAFLLIFVFKEANVNRINILWIPFVYYAFVGLYSLAQKDYRIKVFSVLIYAILFILFGYSYYQNNITFTADIKDAIQFVNSDEFDKVYVEYGMSEPHIYTLFYNQINPHEFIDTVEYFNTNVEFNRVKAFGKYIYDIPNNAKYEPGIAYVLVNNGQTIDITDKVSYKVFNDFTVIYQKKES